MRTFMTSGLLAAGFLALVASSAMAADSFGLENEQVVEIEGRVVDIACALKGDCPRDCGGGKRLLGLLTADGKLRMATKGATDFAAPTLDLLPYCGKTIQADALLIDKPAMTVVMVQNIREMASQPWVPTTKFEADAESRNGKAEFWMRNDPTVKRIIDKDGVLGVPGLAPPK